MYTYVHIIMYACYTYTCMHVYTHKYAYTYIYVHMPYIHTYKGSLCHIHIEQMIALVVGGLG